jgi:hypothetical protein
MLHDVYLFKCRVNNKQKEHKIILEKKKKEKQTSSKSVVCSGKRWVSFLCFLFKRSLTGFITLYGF